MARLPRLFRIRAWVPKKNLVAADLGKFNAIFFIILKMVYCVYPLESPRWGDSNENTKTYLHVEENGKDIAVIPAHLALWLTLISSNYPCLEHIFMGPKLFEPLKFYCILKHFTVKIAGIPSNPWTSFMVRHYSPYSNVIFTATLTAPSTNDPGTQQ